MAERVVFVCVENTKQIELSEKARPHDRIVRNASRTGPSRSQSMTRSISARRKACQWANSASISASAPRATGAPFPPASTRP